MLIETRFVFGGLGDLHFEEDGELSTRFVNGFVPTPIPDTGVFISQDPDNRLEKGSDGGFYVSNDLNPDPLAYYLLERGNI